MIVHSLEVITPVVTSAHFAVIKQDEQALAKGGNCLVMNTLSIPCLLIGSLLLLVSTVQAQEDRPTYCDALPSQYSKGASNRQALPKYSTQPTVEYKVQVAILRNTDPREYPFHEKLIARYRPCEQVWVIESRECFTDRSAALRLQTELRNLGYRGAYLVELIGYH